MLILAAPCAAQVATQLCSAPLPTILPVGTPLQISVCAPIQGAASVQRIRLDLDSAVALDEPAVASTSDGFTAIFPFTARYTLTAGPHVLGLRVGSSVTTVSSTGVVTGPTLQWSAPLTVPVNGGSAPPLSPSPEGTMIPTAAQIVSDAGEVWTFGATQPDGSRQVVRAGAPMPGVFGRKLLKCVGIKLAGDEAVDTWYAWSGTAFAMTTLPSCVAAPPPPAPCAFSLAPTAASWPATASTGSVSVTTQAGCAWSSASGAAWLSTIVPALGTGSGPLSYQVATNTGSARTGTLTIAGQTFTVQQAAAPVTPPLTPCQVAIPAITIASWSDRFKAGSSGVATIDLRWTNPAVLGSTVLITDRTIVLVSAQLAGSQTTTLNTPDGSALHVTGLKYYSATKGLFPLTFRVVDSASCIGVSTSPRSVRVN